MDSENKPQTNTRPGYKRALEKIPQKEILPPDKPSHKMKTFLKCAKEAKRLVKQQYRKELTYELLWIHGNKEWNDITWKDFFKQKSNVPQP